MKIVKELREKIDYHNDEINEIRQLIYKAQEICEHNYISDPTSISQFREICTICDKVRWI